MLSDGSDGMAGRLSDGSGSPGMGTAKLHKARRVDDCLSRTQDGQLCEAVRF
jgi:hypothetical protein